MLSVSSRGAPLANAAICKPHIAVDPIGDSSWIVTRRLSLSAEGLFEIRHARYGIERQSFDGERDNMADARAHDD